MNIVLTGFMGTGKSVVGKMLSRKLGWEYADTDQLIAEKAGRSIPQIFTRFGEEHFRSLEKEVVALVTQKNRTVIATGGGTILDPENLRLLSENGILVTLSATPEEIEKRTGGRKNRPLLTQNKNRRETIRNLLAQRNGYYQKTDIRIDTTGQTPAEVLEKLFSTLKIKYPELDRERL